jgi:hypothetical protein
MSLPKYLNHNIVKNRTNLFIKVKNLLFNGLNILILSVAELPPQIQRLHWNLKISHQSNLMLWQQISFKSILMIHENSLGILQNPIINFLLTKMLLVFPDALLNNHLRLLHCTAQISLSLVLLILDRLLLLKLLTKSVTPKHPAVEHNISIYLNLGLPNHLERPGNDLKLITVLHYKFINQIFEFKVKIIKHKIL